MNYLRTATLAIFCLFASCANLPRVTTPTERADLEATLSTIETALAVLNATGKIPSDHYATALGQVADLRADVVASETVPVTVTSLTNRALQIAATWAIKLSPQ